MIDYLKKEIDTETNLETLRKIAKAWQEKAFLAELKFYISSERISNEQIKDIVDIEKVKKLMNL